MSQRDPAKQLAKEISDLRREVRSGGSSSQMRFRSIDGGSIPVFNSDGSQTGSVGLLPDGTTGFQVIDGPKPVAPSAPIIFPLIGGLEITWDGKTFNGDPLPGDFRCVEVHASPYAVYTPDASTLRASLIAAGTFNIQLPSQPWTVVFVIRSTANVHSNPSLGATETPAHAPTAAEVDAARQAAADAATAAAAANSKALQAAGIANGKGTVYTQATAPAGDANGLWIDTGHGNLPNRWSGTAWVPIQDAGIQSAANAAAAAQSKADSAYTLAGTATTKADNAMIAANTAQTSANGKNMVFWRPSTSPPPAPNIAGDLWFVTDLGNRPRIWSTSVTPAAWQDASFQDGAIAGLNVGKLTSGQIAVGQRIIAGLSTGTHAEMSDSGFKVYAADPAGGSPSVVVQMGTQTDDFFGVTDRNGQLLASIDSTGDVNAQSVNAQTLRVGGQTLQNLVGASSGSGGPGGAGPVGAETTIGWVDSSIGGVKSEIGLTEIVVTVSADRWYWIGFDVNYIRGTDTEAVFRIRNSSASQAPGITSPEIMRRNFSNGQPYYDVSAQAQGIWYPPASGQYRLLLTAQAQGAGVIDIHTLAGLPAVLCIDMGPRKPIAAGVNRGGGSTATVPPPPPPPPPTQQRYEDLGPVGRRSWNGSGAVIGNGTDVYQGYEAANGNTRGMFWFDPPPITGTVDRVDVYLYYRHWWFNSGGRILLGLSDQRDVFGDHTFKPTWDPGITVGKPGSATFTVPGDWFPYFRGTNNASYSGRATVLKIGPGPGTNQTYYGVATDCRLRIWYTQ